MMKRLYILVLFICITSVSFGQIYEIGFFAGGTNYIGDIGRTNYIYPNRVGGGLVFKYNVNPRIAYRGNLSVLPIHGDDEVSNNSFRESRAEGNGYNFSNTIFELAGGIEFNFFDYTETNKGQRHTPYILAQVAAINYKTISDYVSEGNSVFKNQTSYSVPVGIGFKGRLGRNTAYAVESAIRFTLIDDLDFTNEDIPDLDFVGNGDDFYVFTGFSIVYTFGRPPCYSPSE